MSWTDEDARWYLANAGRFVNNSMTPAEAERCARLLRDSRERAYLQRPRPRLGAGTVGYARRRRP